MSVSPVGSYGFIDRLVMSSMNRMSKTRGEGFSVSEMASKIVQKEDADGDSALSASETKLSSEVFTKLDTNGDSKLTANELLTGLQSDTMRPQGPPPGPPPGGGQHGGPRGVPDTSVIASNVMQSDDANADGVLSVDESGLSSDEFKMLDTDGDGKVTLDELQAGLKARETERSQERSALAQDVTQATSSTDGSLKSLVQTLAKNQASQAYSEQSWLQRLLQTASQNLTVSA